MKRASTPRKKVRPLPQTASWISFASALICLALGQFFLAQRTQTWSLLPGLLLYAAGLAIFWKAFKPGGKPDTGGVKVSTPLEAWLFGAVLLLALLARTFRLDQFPSGIFVDEGSMAWGSLRILHEGWRPLFESDLRSVLDPLIYYGAALWFHFFSNTQVHLFLFSVFLSLLAFPLIYWAFRQLSDAPTALVALFLLSVARWHMTYSRNCHPAIQIPIYMFGAMAFWLYALRSGKSWAFLAGGLFLGAGFYAYQAYLAFPLLMGIYFFYEWRGTSSPRLDPRKALSFFLSAVAVSWPMWGYRLLHHGMGRAEEGLAFLPTLADDPHPLLAFLRHLGATALMFNREGDAWLIQNIPWHRMLDDVTGVFLILGVFLALWNWRERKNFYALASLGIMCLPAFLSVNPAHGSRAFGALPFAAFLAASGMVTAVRALGGLKPHRNLTWSAAALALSLAAGENYWTYFEVQAKNDDCWRGASVEASAVGRAVARYGAEDDCYLSSRFYRNNTVMFLGYFQADRTFELKLPESLSPNPIPETPRGLLFALEEGRLGVLNLLQSLYPGGETEFFKDPGGHALVYFYRVPAGTAAQNRPSVEKFFKSHFGLNGTYIQSLDWNSLPALVHRDSLINFTFRNDFPLDPLPPLLVHWTGTLAIPSTDHYQFLALTTDQAKMTLDGKTVFFEGNAVSPDISLGKGLHKMDLFFRKTSGTDTALSLAWKKQGGSKFEIVPFDAFRPKP